MTDGNKNLTVIPAENESVVSLTLPGAEDSSKVFQAIQTIQSRELPIDAIQERPGKGGKAFQYVAHGYVTDLLQTSLNQYWEMKVLGYDFFQDKSALATIELSIIIPYIDPASGTQHFFRRTMSEVGAFDNQAGMCAAYAVAAAVSRGLCRVVMRALGVGLEFYRNDEELTPKAAWETITAFAKNALSTDKSNRNANEEAIDLVKAELKARGITYEELPDRWKEAFEMINELRQQKGPNPVVGYDDENTKEKEKKATSSDQSPPEKEPAEEKLLAQVAGATMVAEQAVEQSSMNLPPAGTQSSSGNGNGSKQPCPHCKTVGKYHATTCPNYVQPAG